MPMYVMRIKDKEPIRCEYSIVVLAVLTPSQMVCREKDLQSIECNMFAFKKPTAKLQK